ncbi:hypothetical protein PM082_024304 [Marasmius tenuissimus]|nr:hypothetical protein PM082_024304 [Marasmius tenuissimus]
MQLPSLRTLPFRNHGTTSRAPNSTKAVKMPELVVFDLDYTLWPMFIDVHVTGPLRREANVANEILDRHGQTISLYKDVPHILHRLRDSGVRIAVASRSTTPALARQALELLLVPPSLETGAHASSEFGQAIDFFEQLEIYPDSKLTHFRRIHEETGVSYDKMLFFDDEYRNQETELLGVTFCLVSGQMDLNTFERGLADWRKRQSMKTTRRFRFSLSRWRSA